MIRLENLTKLYGSFVAVDDITLDIPKGVLYGFLGPNGAGKTTTLRMIAGILRPSDGRVLLGGDHIHKTPPPPTQPPPRPPHPPLLPAKPPVAPPRGAEAQT